MTTRSENSLTALKRSGEERMEADRMRDVLLLLESLFDREEITAKIILDCLYDVGSMHLINQKAPCRRLRGVMKFIARMAKPAFRFFALRWFKQTCPKLIADWLHSQVSFQKQGDKPLSDPIEEVMSEQSTALVKVDPRNREIQCLRRQVRWLTRALIGAIAALGGVTLWLVSSLRLEPSQLLPPSQSAAPIHERP